MTEAYSVLYNITLGILGLFLLACLVRAIIGPRIADRLIAINMMGTLIVIIVCILAFVMGEGGLVDVAITYVMLSFLAVVLLSKIYMGVYRAKNHQEEGNKHA
jgi:multicomponent Na+:H+ antiporter subunit F